MCMYVVHVTFAMYELNVVICDAFYMCCIVCRCSACVSFMSTVACAVCVLYVLYAICCMRYIWCAECPIMRCLLLPPVCPVCVHPVMLWIPCDGFDFFQHGLPIMVRISCDDL